MNEKWVYINVDVVSNGKFSVGKKYLVAKESDAFFQGGENYSIKNKEKIYHIKDDNGDLIQVNLKNCIEDEL